MKIKFTLAILLFASLSQAQTPPGATVKSSIIVPQSMRTTPYDRDRTAIIPEGFKLSVYARIPSARFMAIAPNGDLLVSVPNNGNIKLVRPNPTGDPFISNFVTGLSKPHDIVFHKIDATTYVYIAETDKIVRYKYVNGDITGQNREVVVANLPNASTTELRGNYGHALKNIAIDMDHKLYISIASTYNACLSDTQSDPIRGSIYQYDADGKNMKLFAKGVRNAEGLAFVPGTNILWVVINNRDNIAYPYEDNSGNYGKVLPSFVDNNPPEEFTKVIAGGDYGWPFCNPSNKSGYNDMPYDRDFEFNKNGAVDCSKMNRISKGIRAHSAPLGLIFTQNTKMAEPYRNGAIVALHGSWNRSKATGYKVVYFPWNETTQTPGDEIPLVDGFIVPDSARSGNNNTGRPVDIAVDNDGNLFISDDDKGTILKLSSNNITGTNSEESNYLIVKTYVADGKLTANIESKLSGTATISLVNANGISILEMTRLLNEETTSIHLNPTLNSGVYFLKVSIGNKENVSKIVVTR